MAACRDRMGYTKPIARPGVSETSGLASSTLRDGEPENCLRRHARLLCVLGPQVLLGHILLTRQRSTEVHMGVPERKVKENRLGCWGGVWCIYLEFDLFARANCEAQLFARQRAANGSGLTFSARAFYALPEKYGIQQRTPYFNGLRQNPGQISRSETRISAPNSGFG